MKEGISKKTIDKMQQSLQETVGKPVEVAEVTEKDKIAELQKQIEEQNRKLQEMSDLLTQKKDPSIFKHHDSKLQLQNLDTVYLLEPRERDALEKQKIEIEREIRGLHRLLGAVCGGRHKAYEYSTGDKKALKQRGQGLIRQELYNTPPNTTEAEKTRLKHEYDDLTKELRRYVPSYKSQWDEKSAHHQEAVQKELALITVHQKKVARWQNIAKILDPDNSEGWNISMLRKR